MFDKVEYEYYMLMNGQEIKVDSCYNGLFTSYCEYKGYRINEPSYKSVEVSRIENYYLNTPIFYTFCFMAGFYLFWFLFKFISKFIVVRR